MPEKRLSGLVMIKIHRDKSIDMDSLVQLFTIEHPRSMLVLSRMERNHNFGPTFIYQFLFSSLFIFVTLLLGFLNILSFEKIGCDFG